MACCHTHFTANSLSAILQEDDWTTVELPAELHVPIDIIDDEEEEVRVNSDEWVDCDMEGLEID